VSTDSSTFDDRLRTLTELLAADRRSGYRALRSDLHHARELFHQLVAERFAPAFNTHLASMPRGSLQEKQALAVHANEELRRLGLAIKCPKTGQPAALQADTGRHPEAGRYRIALLAGEPTRKKTTSSAELYTVELMARPDRREPLAERWQDAMQERGDRPPPSR
jgi:hypothetical protein